MLAARVNNAASGVTGGAETAREAAERAEMAAAAHDFEAMFLQQLFGQMRQSMQVGGAPEGGLGQDFYQGMFEEAVANSAADQGGIGLAQVLLENWAHNGSPPGAGNQGPRSLNPLELNQRGAIPWVPPRIRPEAGDGVLQAPYPLTRIYSDFETPRENGRIHHGLDIGGVGPNAGLGTPVSAMTQSRVVFVGRPEDDPGRFGTPDRQGGTVVRDGQVLPRSGFVPGYGNVDFFTTDHGSAHTGVLLVTEVEGGPLDGYTLRYMHLGAVRPDLQAGDVVAAGEEIGLMGGTSIQNDLPHVHIDLTDNSGNRVDLEPLLGTTAPTEEVPVADLGPLRAAFNFFSKAFSGRVVDPGESR